MSIEAALLPKVEINKKIPIVKKLQIKIEIPKQLIRLEMELGIISEKTYLVLQEKLQEISRMATGWLEYLQEKEPK